MQQILYTSLNAFPGNEEGLYSILNRSRHNNGIDGVTGLLWSDRDRFLQVIEGPDDSVFATARKIWSDPRHYAIRVLHQIPIRRAEFSSWSTLRRRPDDSPNGHDARMQRLLSDASYAVSKPFYDLISLRGPGTARGLFSTGSINPGTLYSPCLPRLDAGGTRYRNHRPHLSYHAP